MYIVSAGVKQAKSNGRREEKLMVCVISKQTAEDDLDLARCGIALATAEMKQHTRLQAQLEASQVSYNRYKHGEISPEMLALT